MIYVFDANTTEFLQEEDASRPSNPAHLYTLIAPPKIPQGMVALFDGEKWNLFVDYRGRYWDKMTANETKAIESVPSDPPNSNLTDQEPSIPGEYKRVQWNESFNRWDIVDVTEEMKDEIDNSKINRELIVLFHRAITDNLNWDDFKLAIKARATELKDQRP